MWLSESCHVRPRCNRCPAPHPHALQPSSWAHPDPALLPDSRALPLPDSRPGTGTPPQAAPVPSPASGNPRAAPGGRRRRSPPAVARSLAPLRTPGLRPRGPDPPRAPCGPCGHHTWRVAVRQARARRGEEAQEEQRRRRPEHRQALEGAHGAGPSASVLAHRRRRPQSLRTLAGGPAPTAAPEAGHARPGGVGGARPPCPPPPRRSPRARGRPSTALGPPLIMQHAARCPLPARPGVRRPPPPQASLPPSWPSQAWRGGLLATPGRCCLAYLLGEKLKLYI